MRRSAHQRWHAARKRWRHSIRWRLVTLFVLFAMLTSAAFLFGSQRLLRSGWQGWAKPLVADYVDRLADEIGSPPSKDRAIAIAARLPVTVRIEGPRVQFDSHPQQRERWARYRGPHDPDEVAQGWGLVRTTADGHRITFGLTSLPDASRPRMVGIVTLSTLLLLTAAAYAVVHRLLAPLQAIGAGAARYGSGDFDTPIRVRGRDELGDLAERVNGMAKSLQGMLEAKRALLLAISHELRSPLTRARLNAELVDDSEPKAALLRDLAEMRDLINDLLESERIAAGHRALQIEAVDVPALIDELLAARFSSAKVAVEADRTIGPVRADPMRLKLLLRNLVDNALRHSAHAAQPPRVEFVRTAEGLRLAVRDHGPGVDADHLARQAEPFYRPDSARQRATGGVGLGLYLCRLVAEAHGGRLEIRRMEPGLEVAAVWPEAVSASAATGYRPSSAAAGR
jgi:signal transduction histidine kinase